MSQRALFQTHGVVIFVNADGAICHVTHGCDGLLSIAGAALIGKPVTRLLPDLPLAAMVGTQADWLTGPLWRVSTLVGGSPVKVRAFHAAHDLVGLDILPATRQESSVESATVERITRWTSQLQATRDRTELMRAASGVAVSLTGFEGVWAVRIEPDGTGFVEAATVSGDAPDTTGSVVAAIHLPPGDLTVARRPWPFFVADVAEAANELEPVATQALDFDGSALHRPFAPYLDFLASIGVRAAISVPVVANGVTWGRLIGHHPTPAALSEATHSELRLVGLVAGVQLQELLDKEHNEQRLSLAVASAKVLRSIAAARTLADGLRGAPEALLELCRASSAVVAVDGQVHVIGRAQPEPLVSAMLRDARLKFASHDRSVVSTATMAFPSTTSAGGYLAMRLDEAATDLVVWVRERRPNTVQWVEIAAGIHSAATIGDAVSQVGRPESSSEPWTATQVQAVETFRTEIASVTLARYGALQQANNDLERSNTEFDAFAHTIAHDLRAPIRGIRQYVEFLVEEAAPRLTAHDTEQLRAVLRLADRGTTLLDDLMRYAQLGETTWTIEPVDLRTATREAVEQLDQDAVSRAEIQVAEGQIAADPSALRQLLANLIGNAVKYTVGPAQVRVEISTLAEVNAICEPPPRVRDHAGHTPVLLVQDRGVGITQEHLPRVFGLFKRANQSLPHVPGTGAGLAICQRIAQRHGGDIWMSSTVDHGTTVFAVLGP